MDAPNSDDLELLDSAEGLEFYTAGDSVVLSCEATRGGADSARIAFDSLVNAVVELRANGLGCLCDRS